MIEGGVYTLSWTGTAQARVYQGAPTGAYAASPIITASLTAGTNTVVEFNTGTLTRVKLEIGSVATPFLRQSLAKSMADCQRYFISLSQCSVSGYNSVGVNTISSSFLLPVQMRVAPTANLGAPVYSNASSLSTNSISVDQVRLQFNMTATGSGWAIAVPLTLSAEL
jgi:hypothetical protein